MEFVRGFLQVPHHSSGADRGLSVPWPRYCAVTNPADSGVDTDTIMKLVGHSSVEIFLRYRTIKAETLDAAMTRLNTLITRYENAARQAIGIAAL